MQPQPPASNPVRSFVLLAAWLAIGVLALWVGPPLSEHEVIVAQVARQFLSSGDWLVPWYLDTPFLVKPPLTSWLVAAASAWPRSGGALVTDFTARAPSLLASLLTIIVVHRLARSMFGSATAWVAAVVYGTSLGALLYACNATAEALLTLCCAWSVAEFWWSQTAADRAARRWALARFYLALGLGMMAKGPMPMALVALPLALWWWAHRPLRLLAAGGVRRSGRVLAIGIAEAPRRLGLALRKLGLWWGLPLFAACFLPWMLLVAARESYAWRLWNFEYIRRAGGEYPGNHGVELFYYLPILMGLMIPWCLSLPEALAAPFLHAYRRLRSPLLLAWCWLLGGLLLLSVMTVHKPYYIFPLAPAAALLLAPVLHRMFLAPREAAAPPRWAPWLVGGLMLPAFAALWFVARHKYPEEWHGVVAWGTPALAVLATAGCVTAAALYVRARRTVAFYCVGGTGLAVFVLVWGLLGPRLGGIETQLALADGLKRCDVPENAEVFWVGRRPEGRVVYYGGRTMRQVLDPYRAVAENRHVDADALRMSVANDICRRLRESHPVYYVFERSEFSALRALFNPPARELFDVDRGPRGDDEDDWVVVTNVGVESPPSGAAPSS